ncbi:AraC family transcriptional regulator [Myceligenerans pegani]|uniref:Helix-turn-helix transcriptional regulator n=1 Tax=Myceligenerans pegani TaxID=2776917 RepID=A0ABR9N1Z5_9MICO|nr:AraC family transcriptional regulator [Myceligenerans sp. TRM 65318]MBE1877027.1 helix-turn-helix transcriptional regulator [Myceligenerans sp. TRM 65318]MBE3019298.1 helix-turn-helix transcriptional regulator [Myceligenerans sp. TRM 65318]
MGDSSGVGPEARADDDGARPARRARLRRVRSDGTPVYGHDARPGLPPIGIVRLHADSHQTGGHRADSHETGERRTDGLGGAAFPHRPHVHDFHVLLYVHRGNGSVRIDGATHALHDGDVFGVAPGRTVEPGEPLESGDDLAWAVHFLPDVIPALASVSPLAWDHHPLLRIFSPAGAVASPPSPDPSRQDQDGAAGAKGAEGARDPAGGIASVPGPERERWLGWFEDLVEETGHPERTGAPDAMVAGLTRLLVAAARLAPGPSIVPDPLVVRVFEQVENMFRDPVSAGDVARELGYTPGHLTTVVRERSGRTVGEWLAERRLTEARRLLLETDLPLGAVAARTGLADGAYLGRRFRRRYGTSPDRWRRERRADIASAPPPGTP